MSEEKKEKGNSVQATLHDEISSWRTNKKPDETLVSDIKDKGLIQKMQAYRRPDGTLKVFVGSQRWKALRELGIEPQEGVHYEIRTDIHNDTDAALMAYSENHKRRDFSAIEEAHAFATMQKLKMSVKQIAAKNGVSEAYVRERLNLLELPRAIQKGFEEGTVAMSYGVVLATLKDNAEIQLAVYKRLATSDWDKLRSVEEAESVAASLLTDHAKKVVSREKYGPCPKCGAKEVSFTYTRGQIQCDKCGFEYDGDTKEPWAVKELKKEAKSLGLELQVGDGKAQLTQADATKMVIAAQEQAKLDANPDFKTVLYPSDAVLSLLANPDNISAFEVDGRDVTIKLVEDPKLHFIMRRRDWKNSPDLHALVTVQKGWREEDELDERRPVVLEFFKRAEGLMVKPKVEESDGGQNSQTPN